MTSRDQLEQERRAVEARAEVIGRLERLSASLDDSPAAAAEGRCVDCGDPVSPGSTTGRCRRCYLRLPLHLKHPLHAQPRRVIVEVLAELRRHLAEDELVDVLAEAFPPGRRPALARLFARAHLGDEPLERMRELARDAAPWAERIAGAAAALQLLEEYLRKLAGGR